MKALHKLLVIFIIPLLLWGCEDVIYPALPEAEPVLIIDAWLNNKPDTQIIKIKQSLPYFESQELPGIRGAEVRVTDSNGKTYVFVESELGKGDYYWDPISEGELFGEAGLSYTLAVTIGDEVYHSFTAMNDVPAIDSINFRFEPGNDFFPDSYFAAFYADDLIGPGDTYWIRAYKNGTFLNKPGEINLAYDAGFSAGSLVDGITFIQPIRDGINPFDVDDNEDFISPYSPGDSVYVEIHSISNKAYVFLTELIIQTDRPGGFAELFAQPLSNVPTNIEPVSSASKAVGFFNVAAVSSKGRRLDPENLPME